MRRLLLVIALSAAFAFPYTAKAQETSPVYGFEAYGGWLTDTRGQGYGFLGGALDRIVSDNWALTFKVLGSHLYYEYGSGGRNIRATAPGVKVTAGVKYFRPGTLLALTAGVDYRNTSLSPDDPGSRAKGSQAGAAVEGHIIYDFAPRAAVDLIGAYISTGDSWWGRARLKLTAYENSALKLMVGPEGILEGNSDYSGHRLGGLLEVYLIKPRFALLVSGGAKRTSGVPHSGYIGVELYRKFF